MSAQRWDLPAETHVLLWGQECLWAGSGHEEAPALRTVMDAVIHGLTEERRQK